MATNVFMCMELLAYYHAARKVSSKVSRDPNRTNQRGGMTVNTIYAADVCRQLQTIPIISLKLSNMSKFFNFITIFEFTM